MKKIVFILIFFAVFSTTSYASEKIILQLNWKYQFEFAGYIAAKEKGFYKRVGLDVEIKQYNSGDIIKDVLSGRADVGVIGTELFTAMVEHKPVVMLANFFKKSPLVLAVKPSIFTPQDLNGKVFMCGGADIRLTSIGLLIKKFRINFKRVIKRNGPYTIKPFIEGKVDAIPIYITNQTYMLNKLEIPYNVIDPANYGIFAYSGNVFTSKKFLEGHSEELRKFVEATIDGWEYALSHKKEVSEIIYKKYKSNKPLSALLYEADRIEDIIMPKFYSVGSIDKSVVKDITLQFAKILNKKPVNVEKYLFAENGMCFTKSERLFLRKHKIFNVCINPDWKPIEYYENGEVKGVTIKILKKVFDKLGVKYRIIKTKSWEKSQEYLRNGVCDILPSAVDIPARRKYALFTKPYITYELFVFSKKGRPFVVSLNDLDGKSVARRRGSALIKILRSKYPEIRVIQTETIKDMFMYVDSNRAYCTIATLPVATYYIKRGGYKDITIIGSAGMSYPLSMEVRKDMPLLVSSLNKVLSSITPKDISLIWHEESEKQVKYEYKHFLIESILKITSIFGIVVFVMVVLLRVFLKKNRELTEIKERLEESVKNFKVITKYSMQMTIIYKNLICIEANDVACKTLGYPRRELIGKNVFDLLTDEGVSILKDKLKIDHTKPYELDFRNKNGEIVHTLAKGDNIKLNGEDVRLGTAVDVTELKVLQKKLKQLNEYLTDRIKEETEKNLKKDRMMMQQSKFAATGEMMAMIAHQWRQPLNAISATVNNLLLKVQLGQISNELFEDKLRNVMEYVRHLSQTIDDFRKFFNPAVMKERAIVDDIILQIIKIIKDYIESKNIKMNLNLNCKSEVLIYANELKHVVLNLINNARDAIVERKIKNPFINISTYCDNKVIRITVKDNAGGIEENVLPKIFDAYFTTKDSKKGTGLGLYMSKIMIEEHMKGSIFVKNEEDGVKFEIILPVQKLSSE